MLAVTGIDPVTLSVLPVGLDFGSNVTSLASLQPSTPVYFQLSIQTNLMAAPGEWLVTPEFAGDLYPVESTLTNSAILFTNANAWAVVYDRTNLDQILQGSVTNESVLARVSVPTLGLRDVVVKLKPQASTAGSLVHDYTSTSFQFHTNSAGLIESIDTVVRRLNVGTITNTLIPTAQTNVFASTNGQITATFTGSPEAAIQSGTNLPVTLAVSTLGLSNTMVVVTPGTATNAFATDDRLSAELPAGLESDGDYGGYFGWAFGCTSPEQIAASGAGEIHPYYVRFKGPATVLDWLRERYPTKIALGPDNNYYTADANNPDTPEAHILAALRRVRTLPLVQSPWDAANEALGFYYGLGAQAVDDIKGIWHIAVLSVEFQYAVPKYLKAYINVSVGVANDQECQMVADVGTTAEQVSAAGKLTWDLWVAVQQSQWGTLEAAASGDLEAAWAKSETCRWIAAFMIEAMVAINNEYVQGSAFHRGEIKGRVTLEAVLVILPMTKAAQVGQLSKVEFLTQLKNKQWIQESAALRNILEKVLKLAKAEKPVPPIIGSIKAEIPMQAVGSEAAGEAERIWGLYRMKRVNGMTENQAMLTAMEEVGANAGDLKVAVRFKGVVDYRLGELPHSPSAAEYEAQFTYENWKSLIQSKQQLAMENNESLRVIRGADGHEGNHIVAKKLQEALEGPPYNIPITNPNDTPVGILTIADHRTGESAFHKVMNAWEGGLFNDTRIKTIGQNPDFPTATHVLNEYIRFLKSLETNPEFAHYPKVARGFAAKFGVTITQ